MLLYNSIVHDVKTRVELKVFRCLHVHERKGKQCLVTVQTETMQIILCTSHICELDNATSTGGSTVTKVNFGGKSTGKLD